MPETSTHSQTIADGLRTIAARLVLSEDHRIDGQTLIAFADSVGRLESEAATLREGVGEVAMSLNDTLTAMQALSNNLGRERRLVDGLSISR